MAGLGVGSTRKSGLSTVHLPSVILQGTPIIFVMVSLSDLLCGSNLLISRALNTPSTFPVRHSTLLFRIPSKIPNLYLGFFLCMGSVGFALPTPCHHVGQILVSVSWTGCLLHFPRTTAELVSRP